MKINHFAVLLMILTAYTAVKVIEKDDIVLQHYFDGPDEEKFWKPYFRPAVKLDTLDGNNRVLCIHHNSNSSSSTYLKIPLQASTLRDSKLRIQANVKAENITKPPKAWNGIKIMLSTQGPSSSSNNPQQNLPYGTFDWLMVDFIAIIPIDVEQVSLTLGLELVSGTAWIDNLKIIVHSAPRTTPPTPPIGSIYKGHNLTRLRGTMIGRTLREKDFRDLGSWNSNHIRWQLGAKGLSSAIPDNNYISAYETWLESSLQQIDSMLPICRQLGIHILIDLHTPPGDRNEKNECYLFKEKGFQDIFVSLWEKIAQRYKYESIIWGYDLVNEPVEGIVSTDVMNWRDLAIATVQRIRTVDSEHAIIIEAAPWGSADALAAFEPLPSDKIVYSFHMYTPSEVTHQNVNNNVPPVPYPGVINGVTWNKDQVRLYLKLVLDWQKIYNVHIYVGEFSCILWAPNDSAYNYLSDVIDIFEENEWDWAYHAFREWQGWSVEHIGNKSGYTEISKVPTNRQILLMDWFKNNEH